MDRETLRRELKEILEEDCSEPLSTLADGTCLKEELGLDSVDMVGAIMKIEQRFRIRLAHAELVSVGTAGQLLDLMTIKIEALPNALCDAKEAPPPGPKA